MSNGQGKLLTKNKSIYTNKTYGMFLNILPWLFIEACGSKLYIIAISFYCIIVHKNISCDVGITYTHTHVHTH